MSRDINLARKQMRMTESALSAPASGWNGYTVLFKRLHNGIGRFAENNICLILNGNGDFDFFLYIKKTNNLIR